MQNYGESLWFPVIPMEMLSTDAQTPQILINIDGTPAMCLDLNCDFTYTESDALITSQSLDEYFFDEVIIYGTNLPDHDDDVMWFGPTRCTEMEYTAEAITCILDDTRITGEWVADILTVYGLLPNEISESITIPVDATSISPSTDVNFLGGDVFTITGDSFGYDTDVVTVTFSDSTICTVLTVSMTEITCRSTRFTSDATQTQSVALTINGVSDSSLSFELLS